MNKIRFQWIVGLLLIASLMTLSAVFCRFTLRIAAEMPKESVQQLHQAIHQAQQQKTLRKKSKFLLRIERFIVGVQNAAQRKKEARARLKEEQNTKVVLPEHTSNPYQTDPLPFESEESIEQFAIKTPGL